MKIFVYILIAFCRLNKSNHIIINNDDVYRILYQKKKKDVYRITFYLEQCYFMRAMPNIILMKRTNFYGLEQ